MAECMKSTSAAAVFESPEAESAAGLAAGWCGGPRVARKASLSDIEVLTLVERGLTDRAIGRQLAISEATVKTHLVRVFAKLGVTDRISALYRGPTRGHRSAPTRTARRAA